MTTRSIQDLMSQELVTITPDATIAELGHLLAMHMITGVPVVDGEGNLLGVVSASDIASRVGQGAQPEKTSHDFYIPDLGHHKHGSGRTVKDIMTSLVCSVDVHTELREVVDTMLNYRVHRVLVTRHGKLVGLLSALDLLEEFRDLLAAR